MKGPGLQTLSSQRKKDAMVGKRVEDCGGARKQRVSLFQTRPSKTSGEIKKPRSEGLWAGNGTNKRRKKHDGRFLSQIEGKKKGL